jgi:methyl-accepting chemotaxis protein
MNAMSEEENPMAEAEAQLYRRIQELRARARSERAPGATGDTPPAMPDLRTILARAEANVGELRQTAAALEQSLPEAVERAVERAMDERTTPRRLDELRDLVRALAGQMDQVNRDLLTERLGRIEDLELLVDLISTGMASLRQDMSDVTTMVSRMNTSMTGVAARLDQPLQVTVERPRQSGVRDLFRPTEQQEEPDPAPRRG